MSHQFKQLKQYRSIKRSLVNKSSESTSNKQVQSWAVRDSSPSRNRMTNNKITGTFNRLIKQKATEIRFFSGRCRSLPSLRGSRASYLGRNLRKPSKNVFPIAFNHHPLMYISTLVPLTIMALMGTIGIINPLDTYASDRTLSMSISDNVVDLNVAPSTKGTFAKSSPTTISASTTNSTGYTLKLVAAGGTSSTYPTALVNGDNKIETITSAKTEAQFSTLTGDSSIQNKWGYLPSRYCTGSKSSTCEDNIDFLSSPDNTTGDVLNVTDCANNTTNCPNATDTYELAIGARVDSAQTLGTYTNTFNVVLVGNAVPYIITYIDNTVSNMPVDVSATADTTAPISSNTPQRNGYTFIGWCTVVPTNNTNGTDTCSGTAYQPNGTITLDQTGGANTYSLYAMWGNNYTINGLTYMQDFATMSEGQRAKVISSMGIGEQYQLIDNRDNTKYWIARQADDNIWMTQNLDLCVGCTGAAALTSDNTDLNSYGYGIYSTDYTMSNGTITWAPTKTGTDANSASPITSDQTITIVDNNNGTVTWPNSQIYPWSAEGGTRYYYAPDTNTEDTPSDTCNNGDNGTDWCKHYHVGNYYNWTEAIASSNSTNMVDNYAVAENSICPAGWRLPKGQSSSTSTASTREFGQLLYAAGVTTTLTSGGANYATNGAINIRKAPLFLARSGGLWAGALHASAQNGRYWSSTVYSSTDAYYLRFDSSNVYSANNDSRYDGRSVRCLVR